MPDFLPVCVQDELRHCKSAVRKQTAEEAVIADTICAVRLSGGVFRFFIKICDRLSPFGTTYAEGGEFLQQDNIIISLLQKRDETALQLIRTQNDALCYQIAYRMTGSREDAEEVLNDMLLAVWNSIPPQKPDNLRAYVTALTGRIAIKKYEHTHRIKRGGTQFAAALDELSEIIPSDTYVEREIEQRELTDALTAWLRTLQPDQRRIFMQRYYLSESVRQIAEQNQMGVSAVKMTLLRLRKKLKDYLRKEDLL